MTYRVHNTQRFLSQEALDYLRAHGCEVSTGQWEGLPDEESVLAAQIRGLDAVIAGGERYTRRVLEAADRLKVVARTGAGTDKVDLAAATELGIWVTNTPGATSPAVADFTIGVMLCLLRNIHISAAEMKRRVWQRYQGRELGSMTVGVVGAGSIGRDVVRRLAGFGSRVLLYDLAPDAGFAEQYGARYVELDELMAESDIVTLHVWLDAGTRGLIDARRLGLMKRGSYVVNTSRAAVLDRAALLRALQDGTLAGAALDVHDPAPCAPDDPLVLLDNVLATPWNAFNTTGATDRMSIGAAREVVEVLEGRTPAHAVNDIRHAQHS